MSGANSFLWFDLLVNSRRLVTLDPDDSTLLDRTIPFDLCVPAVGVNGGVGVGVGIDVSLVSDSDIPSGYRFGRHAWSWMRHQLGMTSDEIQHAFAPIFTARVVNAITPITDARPCILDSLNGPTSSFIQYMIINPNPKEGLLRYFTQIDASPYTLLYRVRGSYINEVHQQLTPSVNLGQPCAIAKKHMKTISNIELTQANCHQAVQIGQQTYGIIWKCNTMLTEQESHDTHTRARMRAHTLHCV